MMRNFKVLFLMCLMVLTSLGANAEEKEPYDWSRVMNAIIQVESKGNPKAYNPNGDCVGILQITKGLVIETNKILKMKGSSERFTLADRWDAEKSKRMFVILQEHFNKNHDIEKAIKGWNLGFYAKNIKNKGNGYYAKVMKNYNKNGS